MSLWLFKSDPDVYSWHDLVKVKKEIWDGVSNNLALKHLRSVKKGDRIFIYHSGSEKAIIGIAEAVSDSYPDSSEQDSKLAVVDVKAQEPLKKTVALSEIKSNKKFASWELVRFSRLSVMPVTESAWQGILQLSKKE